MRMTCCICERPAKTKGIGTRGGPKYSGPLCGKHLERLRRHNDPLGSAPKGPKKGSHWRNPEKRYDNGEGYLLLFRPEHPNSRKTGYILEHVFVMSEKLGRPLFKDETVHHRNGDRSDNREENLELWSVKQPKGQRVEDKIQYAKEILDRYGTNSCE